VHRLGHRLRKPRRSFKNQLDQVRPSSYFLVVFVAEMFNGRHVSIVRYKTAFYSFYLPVALAMYMATIPDSYPPPNDSPEIKPYANALSILLDIGQYFQIPLDFLDYHATPEKLGKVGTGTCFLSLCLSEVPLPSVYGLANCVCMDRCIGQQVFRGLSISLLNSLAPPPAPPNPRCALSSNNAFLVAC
jgi:hypothetical protein